MQRCRQVVTGLAWCCDGIAAYSSAGVLQRTASLWFCKVKTGFGMAQNSNGRVSYCVVREWQSRAW